MSAITRFLEDVLLHVASQGSQHERGRWWSHRVFLEPPDVIQQTRAMSFLSRPPADTRVLIGYVKSKEHLEWIHRTGLYNLRGDSRTGRVELGGEELAAEFVVLYGPGLAENVELMRVVDQPRVVPRERMEELAYPIPKGRAYFCLAVQSVDLSGSSDPISLERVLGVRARVAPNAPRGAPVATTWLELLNSDRLR